MCLTNLEALKLGRLTAESIEKLVHFEHAALTDLPAIIDKIADLRTNAISLKVTEIKECLAKIKSDGFDAQEFIMSKTTLGQDLNELVDEIEDIENELNSSLHDIEDRIFMLTYGDE